MTYKVAVQELYTTHKLTASQMSICRKCFVFIYILEKFNVYLDLSSIKGLIKISMTTRSPSFMRITFLHISAHVSLNTCLSEWLLIFWPSVSKSTAENIFLSIRLIVLCDKVFVWDLTRCLCGISQGICTESHKVFVRNLTRCLYGISQGVCAESHKVFVRNITRCLCGISSYH